MLALIKQNNTNKMSSFSHSSQFCLFIDNPSWVTAAVFANLVAGQGLNFDPSCFLVIQFQSTCAIHPLCTWNWTKSRGHNQLSTDREQPTESSPGKHRLENQLFFFTPCLSSIAWQDFPSLCATIAAWFAASIGRSVPPMSPLQSLLCVSSDGMGRRPWENRGGFCWEPRFLQIERGELGLGLACSADRAPHYVDPIGFPLLHSEEHHRTKATRHLVSITLHSLQRNSRYI